jgi:hypothetical protein
MRTQEYDRVGGGGPTFKWAMPGFATPPKHRVAAIWQETQTDRPKD